ncbi:cupin domain-containing protein [Pseudomonas japonica]|uniref:cupin domain-containing protein n=1 Tax=Pseudomonas japonica TaxID=256466 RepID=UPI0005A72ACD|nr:cupin domain-containing protein [Pseudomonas japonica]
MFVTRIDDARPYDPPGHHGIFCLRLQGAEATPAVDAVVGLSHLLPQGRAVWDASPVEKIYVVCSGEITVCTDDTETVLKAFDTCCIQAGERRSLVNRSNLPATMLVVMAPPSPIRN